MKIVYIHQHFCTNEGVSGTRSYDVSRYMVQAGHEIHMICGIGEGCGLKRLPWYRMFKKENIDGINLIICNVYSSNSHSRLKKHILFVWFAIVASIASLCVRKPDIVFATSTPLTIGIPGYITAKLKRVPFVFEVRDIWPESFIRSGWIKETDITARIMAWMEAFFYKKASKILLVSKGFEDRLIERGIDPAKLKTVLLGADGDIFKDIVPDHGFIDRYGLQGKKIAIYTGSHGANNGLDYILDAAKLSVDRPDIVYVLMGFGRSKPAIQKRIEDEGIDNVVIAEPVRKDKLPGVLAVCHFGLMILRDINEPRPVTPNKMFDYIFMGMPMLVNFEGPTIDIVRQIGCGKYVDPKKPQELANAVSELSDCEPEILAEMGKRAKEAAWERFDRKSIADELIQVLEEAVKSDEKVNTI